MIDEKSEPDSCDMGLHREWLTCLYLWRTIIEHVLGFFDHVVNVYMTLPISKLTWMYII